MANEDRLSDGAWASIAPLMPTSQPGARRVDDRRVISGIIHMLQSGCRWQDGPAVCGPPTTIYNRCNRWRRQRLWQKLCEALAAGADLPDDLAIDRGGPGGCACCARAKAVGRCCQGRCSDRRAAWLLAVHWVFERCRCRSRAIEQGPLSKAA